MVAFTQAEIDAIRRMKGEKVPKVKGGSKYAPHQGKRECARRLRQKKAKA